MGLLLDLLMLIGPILLAMLVIAAVLKWSHKADSVAQGFGMVLTYLGNFLKEDVPIQTPCFPYSIDYSTLKKFNPVLETFFRKSIFSNFYYENNCECANFIVHEPLYDSEITEMLEIELRNFLLEIENLNVSAMVVTWAYVTGNSLFVYFALNKNGVNWLNQQRANTVSRQLLLDSEVDLME